MTHVEHAISVFMAFFAIMNPVANTAVFVALVGQTDKVHKRQIAAKALYLTFLIIFVFSVFGKSLFHLFDITLPALRVTGGVLIFLIGYHMLHGSNSSLHTAEDNSETDTAVSPLAVPLLAGPGTIATAMNYSASGGLVDIFVTLSAFLLLCLITFLCFIFSNEIVRKIGNDGLGIITRLMGLILAVIGSQMLIVGVRTALADG